MGQPYVGEIKLFAGNFAPAGWMFCAGQLLPISENETLFQLIGTTYGGDGESTFQLPNLQSRVPMHMGNGFILAETGGVEKVTLTVNQMPGHSHPVVGLNTAATQSVPGSTSVLANEFTSSSTPPLAYAAGGGGVVPLHPNSVTSIGGSLPHDNMQPYLAISFIISLFGVFPSQN